MKFKKYVEKKENKKISKIEMYLEYYKNLSPKNFKISKKENKIVIEIK